MAIPYNAALSRQIYAEELRLNKLFGYQVCGNHAGDVRPDGAPAVCVRPRHHKGDYFVQTP